MKLFLLQRNEDVSGVSGVGFVAEGVQFTDGTCVLKWLTAHSTVEILNSMDDVLLIHGHEGRTQAVYLDEND